MRVYENFDLTDYNSYKINSKCQRAYFLETEKEVIEHYSSNKDFLLLGSGHNIILSKKFYDQDFVIFKGNFSSIEVIDNDVLEIEAGAMMSDASKVALDASLSGIEIFYDIPSSLGGAIVMNAGAAGEEIKDVLLKVRYLDLSDSTVKEILRTEMTFEYRNSFFQQNRDKIILKAWLKLHPSNKSKIASKMEQTKASRWAKQPKALPNAGSVFKRPKGYFVGAIIDELNLKGYSVGGAMISEKHGGFIVNYNNAIGADIIEIIDHVQKLAFERLGVNLEIEQQII